MLEWASNSESSQVIPGFRGLGFCLLWQIGGCREACARPGLVGVAVLVGGIGSRIPSAVEPCPSLSFTALLFVQRQSMPLKSCNTRQYAHHCMARQQKPVPHITSQYNTSMPYGTLNCNIVPVPQQTLPITTCSSLGEAYDATASSLSAWFGTKRGLSSETARRLSVAS